MKTYEKIAGQFLHAKGVFSRLIAIRAQKQEPQVFIRSWLANLTQIHLANQKLAHLLGSAGSGYDEKQALYSAMGEALERYSAVLYSTRENNQQDIFAAWQQLDSPYTPAPCKYNLFSGGQYANPRFSYRPFLRENPVHWLPAQNITQKAPGFVPKAFVLLPYLRPDKRKEIAIAPALSTGLALADRQSDAIMRGIYEVVERDAVALAWNWNFPVTRLENDGWVAELTARIGLTPEYQVFAYDVTQDIPLSTAMVFLVRHTAAGEFFLSLGSACRGTIQEAVEKAFLEAASVSLLTPRKLQTVDKNRVAKDFGKIHSFGERAVFYSIYPELISAKVAAGDILVAAQKRAIYALPGEPPSQELDALIAAVAKRGFEILAHELTIESLREHGLHVVRTVIPGLLGLEGAHKYRYCDERRVCHAAQDRAVEYSENPLPHPLP